MKQLRYLLNVSLYKMVFEKTSIGERTSSNPTLINTYECYVIDNANDMQSHDYGATIKNRRRISSVRNELEAYLTDLVNYTNDNISDYRINVGTKWYIITVVKPTYIDVEISDV